MIFIAIDRLGKRAYSIPYKKTVIAKDIARMYFDRI